MVHEEESPRLINGDLYASFTYLFLLNRSHLPACVRALLTNVGALPHHVRITFPTFRCTGVTYLRTGVTELRVQFRAAALILRIQLTDACTVEA
ncbi:MAG TPA: hypothetical protein DD706_12150 [Nitrospiraceae bacterium]|nr:hypothetical protein [Nitrospiraceae bacterium]